MFDQMFSYMMHEKKKKGGLIRNLNLVCLNANIEVFSRNELSTLANDLIHPYTPNQFR
jgi:hypothetical protein